MTLEEMYFVSQIIAATAIVASLLFVAMQLRQADRTQRAAMHQNRTQRGMDLALRAAAPELAEAVGRFIRQDEKATPENFLQVMGVLRAMILNLDDVAWQHKAGMLDKATLDNTVTPMRRIFSQRGIRGLWQMTRGTYSAETAALVDKLVIADVPLDTGADPIGIWRAIVAQIEPAAPG